MAENKTVPTDASVTAFLDRVPEEGKRRDGYVILEMMKRITGREPEMWGDSIIGFGSYHYKYESGREGDMPLLAFSPRKQNLSLYILSEVPEFDQLLRQLGKYKTGKVCLYINKLSDVDMAVLEQLATITYEYWLNKKPE